MINANELRIGNLVLEGENIVKIECIESKFFNDYDGGNDYPIKFSDKDLNILMCDLSELEAIPITEEMLLKCGFVLRDHKYELDMMKSKLFLRKACFGGFYWGINSSDCSFCEFDDVKAIKYVHQLQNFIHSLTGQELNVDNLL